MTIPRLEAPLSDILFDCDSTLVALEGIDELGGTRPEIVEMTREAMAGRQPLDRIYQRRLGILQPTLAQVEEVGRKYVGKLVQDAVETVAALHHLGKAVHIVSGGIKQAVEMLSGPLAIPDRRIHAVELKFDDEGRFVNVDPKTPLTRNEGKREIAKILTRDGRRSAFVGDGVTDLEAAEAVTRFVGFGGVVQRPEVREKSPLYIRCPNMAPLLHCVCTEDELRRLRASSRFMPLMVRCDALRPFVEVRSA